MISVADYMRHWLAHSDCSVECAGIALAYVLRCGVRPTPLNVHRLLVAALCVAAKWRDDHYYANEFYAAVGGVSVTELNRLEAELLRLCDWAVCVGGE
eukprot:gene41784-29999_t